MKMNYYSENSKQFLFSVYYSEKYERNGYYRNHYHTVAELGYVIKGDAKYIVGDKSYNVSGGDLVIIRSNERHCIPEVYSEKFSLLNIQFSSYFLWNVCSDFIKRGKIQSLINTDIEINNLQSSKEIGKAFSDFSEIFDKYAGDSFKIRYAVLNLICIIAEKLSDDGYIDIPIQHINDVEKAVSFIKSNYMNDISLYDIAKSAAMSRSYFSNIFRNVTGISPYNYLITTRIEKATEQLKNTTVSVMDIAEGCGFTSLTSFNKAFKQLIGITPTEYRKNGK